MRLSLPITNVLMVSKLDGVNTRYRTSYYEQTTEGVVSIAFLYGSYQLIYLLPTDSQREGEDI